MKDRPDSRPPHRDNDPHVRTVVPPEEREDAYQRPAQPGQPGREPQIVAEAEARRQAGVADDEHRAEPPAPEGDRGPASDEQP